MRLRFTRLYGPLAKVFVRLERPLTYVRHYDGLGGRLGKLGGIPCIIDGLRIDVLHSFRVQTRVFFSSDGGITFMHFLLPRLVRGGVKLIWIVWLLERSVVLMRKLRVSCRLRTYLSSLVLRCATCYIYLTFAKIFCLESNFLGTKRLCTLYFGNFTLVDCFLWCLRFVVDKTNLIWRSFRVFYQLVRVPLPVFRVLSHVFGFDVILKVVTGRILDHFRPSRAIICLIFTLKN